MLARGNADAFAFAVSHLPSAAPLLKLDRFAGCHQRHHALQEKLGVKNRLITCDKWIFEGAQVEPLLGGSSHLTHGEYRELCAAPTSKYSNLRALRHAYTVEMFSDEFLPPGRSTRRPPLPLIGPAPSASVTSTGNHSYAFAQRDFQNVDLCLESGGFILLTTSADGSEWEVCQVVPSESGGRYDLVANNPNYLSKNERSRQVTSVRIGCLPNCADNRRDCLAHRPNEMYLPPPALTWPICRRARR